MLRKCEKDLGYGRTDSFGCGGQPRNGSEASGFGSQPSSARRRNHIIDGKTLGHAVSSARPLSEALCGRRSNSPLRGFPETSYL